jgi:hypothetical protein
MEMTGHGGDDIKVGSEWEYHLLRVTSPQHGMRTGGKRLFYLAAQ